LAGQRIGVETKNAYHSLLSYDGMGRLTGIDYKNPAAETLAKYGLAWDTASRIVAMNLNGEPAQYGYDVTNQLVSATYKNLPTESYQYDANGNRKNFVTGKNNQLTSDGTFKYTYDNEGNRIAKVSKKSRTEYFWDHRNRLVKVVADGKIVEYTYDHLNRLLQRNNEYFVHDGWQIVLTLDSKGKVKERYLWGANQDELLSENNNWMLCDHLGTVRDVVNKNSKIVSHLEYSSFGELLNISGTKTRFRYTGKMSEEMTELQWNINRWYDAKVGRWISEDPIGFQAGDANLTRYVSNKVDSSIDLTGTKKLIFLFEGFGGYIGGPIFGNNPIYTTIKPLAVADSEAIVFYEPQNAGLITSQNVAIAATGKIFGTCKYHTLVLVGHSYGGDKVHEIAHFLIAKKIKINLVFTIDPVAKWTYNTTPTTIGDYGFVRSSNANSWLNFYQRVDNGALLGLWSIWGDIVKNAMNTEIYKGVTPLAGAHMSIVSNPSVTNAFTTALATVPLERSDYKK
jgi:RHS repeat-associated protein